MKKYLIHELEAIQKSNCLYRRLSFIRRFRDNIRATQFIWYMLAGVIVVSDQITKLLIASRFALGERVHMTSFFNLVHVRNRGAAFSLLADANGWQRYLFIVLAFGVSIYLVRMLGRSLTRVEAVGYSFILGGALGNVTDRILRGGAVVDFIDIHWHGVHWPAFNLADVGISLGIALLLIGSNFSTSKLRYAS